MGDVSPRDPAPAELTARMTPCPTCRDTRVVFRYWKHATRRRIASDWLFCSRCFPHSLGDWAPPDSAPGWEEIPFAEFLSFAAAGWTDLTGW